MSLQLWLPLNGDYENQGLSDIEMTCAAPLWSDAGKIGKCANFNASYNNIIYTNTKKFNYTDNFSFSLWLYHTGIGSTQTYAFTVGRADMGGYGYGIRIVSSTQIGVWFGSICPTINCSANTWHHIAGVVGNGQLKIYIDGALVNTSTISTRPTYSDGDGLGIGCFRYISGHLYPFSGRINDFRIYDHALSPKEVKEISKGLVLHYPLNNNGMGCKNYIKDSYYIKPTICAWGNSTYARTQVEIDDEYFTGTFWKFTRGASGSGDVRIGWGESRIPIDSSIYNDNPLQFSIWVKSTTGTALTVYSARMSDQEHSSMGTFNIPANKWTKVECSRTFLSSSSAANVNELEIYLHISYNTDAVFAKAKLEVADRPTPWCPNEADELYSQLGMDENIEYDVSGYGNNALKTSVNYNSDSPRYQTSTVFDGTSSGINLNPSNINPVLTQGGSTPFAYSFWIKNTATDRGIIFGDHKEGVINANISIEKHAKNELRFYWNEGYIDWFCTNTILSLDTWIHIAITYNGSQLSVYRNGVLTDSKTITLNSGNKTVGDYFQIGRDSRINNTMLEGSLSDFRIYATCLSDANIQELYNRPISIDNNGNMFAVEAVEESATGPQFSKTGAVEATTINALPLYDMETKVLDDGSAWARILHHNNRAGTVLFTTSNVLDIQTTDLYSRLKILEQFRDDNGSFEFMAIQPDIDDTIYRWKQTNNPTQSGSLSGYVNIENGSGGLVYGPTDYALMSESGTTTNWWCAVGAKQPYNGGIPGFGRNTVAGTLDFYVRIDTVSPNKQFKLYNKYIECNDIIEY